jgi:hypothetical protein
LKTKTTKRPRKSLTRNPFDLTGMIDKGDVADNLALLTGDDDLSPVVEYQSDYCLFINNDGHSVDRGSLGHTFRVSFDGRLAGDAWLDDRQGDLRVQLAAELERRAEALQKMAAVYRREAK